VCAKDDLIFTIYYICNTDPQVDLDNVTIDSSSTDSEYFSADDSDPRYIDAVHTQPELEDQVGSVAKLIP
jgi:hypothetical protein